jgi:hypothetical protein
VWVGLRHSLWPREASGLCKYLCPGREGGRLHGELNALVDTVQVVKEVPQPVGAVWPHEASIIHVTEPAEWLMGSPVDASPRSPP